MNLVLGDVVETIYVVEEDDEEEDIRVRYYTDFAHYHRYSYHMQTTTKKSEMLFVRGKRLNTRPAKSWARNN